ncbi:uncharacterized protein LOC6504057 [Drosophila ananassae]|uniref:uncharacterized protein LOC6504057 n=1 Tax=Drosophila ananassae TaxID=7217 RepID=UPI0013A5D516|nr:uncharacterized protein LOC6504057 [Drosophila ananassae]
MSYTHLLRHQNVVDDCQRVSCNRGPGCALSGRCVISRDIVLGCEMELSDPDLPYMLEPTWSVYLRSGPDGGDLSKFVQRVSFRMSPKLPLRLHVADTAPFEISEVLGSDFPVEVQVQYIDARMTPTTYIFRPRAVREGHGGQREEMHDKMIFVNPSPAMRLNLQPLPVPGAMGVAGDVGASKMGLTATLGRDDDFGGGEEEREEVGDSPRRSEHQLSSEYLLKKRFGGI